MTDEAAAAAPGDARISAIFLFLVVGFLIAASALVAGGGGAAMVFAFVLLGWIISLCLHEWGHAYVAYLGGDHSVVGRGYLTLNPLRYVNPLMSIGLPLLFLALGGIGFPGGAVYVQPERLRNGAWRAAMSAAGPMMNLVSLVVLGLLHASTDAIATTPFSAALALLAFLQATALILNLLPVPGLDGFGVLQALLPASARASLAKVSNLAVIIFLAVMIGAPQFFAPLWAAAFGMCGWLGIQPQTIVDGLNLFRFWEVQ